MERIEISTAKISLSDIVKHVSRDRISIELSEDQIPLAMIVPIDRARSMADLDRALREFPRPGEPGLPISVRLSREFANGLESIIR